MKRLRIAAIALWSTFFGCAAAPHWDAALGECAPYPETDDGYVDCALEHSRVPGRPAGEVADELARTAAAHGRENQADFDHRQALRARLVEVLPAALASVGARRELRVRRARLLGHEIWRLDPSTQLSPLVKQILDEGDAFHASEAQRLEERYPVSASLHRCHLEPGTCPLWVSPRPAALTLALENPAGFRWSVRGPSACERITSALAVSAPPENPHALAQTLVNLELVACETLPSFEQRTSYPCGASQSITVTETVERAVVRAVFTVDAKAQPVEVTGERRVRIQPEVQPTGCELPIFLEDAPAAAERAFFNQFTFLWQTAVTIDERLLEAATDADRDGDTDRAMEARAILFVRAEDSTPPADLDWLQERVDLWRPNVSDPVFGIGVYATDVGYVADKYFYPF